MPGDLRIGCSSWTSEAWWGRVYPTDLKDGDRLAWYARHWDTVEIDASYYRDPGAFLFGRWRKATPERFLFTVKFPRDLLDPKRPVQRDAIARFLSNAAGLGEKLGPILLQFPPWVRPGRAATFLLELLDALEPGPRYAIELREAGWFSGAVFERLQRDLTDRHLALAWSFLTYVEVPPALTSDFVYLRFIGDHHTIPAHEHGEIRADRSREIGRWSDRLRAARAERPIDGFVFFNNHFAGFAPDSVNEMRRAMGLPRVEYGIASPPRLEEFDDPARR